MSSIQNEVHNENLDLDQSTAFNEGHEESGADNTRSGWKSPDQKNATGLGRKTSPIIGASALLASKYPSFIDDEKDKRSRKETRVVLAIVAVITACITYGYLQWDDINFQREIDFHYNMGLIGGIMMLIVMLYAFRKRMKILRKVGGIETWYYFHLFGGVLGPILIIFHTDFAFKSVNAIVAFVAMSLVVISGIFGRYIYTRIGYGLHRKLLAIKETEQSLIETLRSHQSEAVEVIERRLSKFALASLAGPRSILRLPLRFVGIRTSAATCYVRASEDLTLMLRSIAQEDGWNVDEYKKRLSEEKRLLRDHINAVVEIARVHLFERLLVRWRVLHIPLLYILLITGLVHVLAVHMY
jgi:hypothetical protein